MKTNMCMADFQYVTSYITRFSIDNGFITYVDKPEVEKNISTNYVINSIENDDENDKLLGVSTLLINIEIGNNEKKISIELEIRGLFTGNKNLDKDKFKTMLSINGYATLYSNARSYIISMSSQSFNGDKIVIPHINLLSMLKDNKEESSKENKEVQDNKDNS